MYINSVKSVHFETLQLLPVKIMLTILMIILHGHNIVHTSTYPTYARLISCYQSAKMCIGGWEFRMKGRALFSGRELRSGRKEKNKKVEVFFRLSVRRSRHLIGCSPPTLWANWRMILKK